VHRILNAIASDIKKETENKSEKGSGLIEYWEAMRNRGREATLSRINAEKIAGYRERLRYQALNTTVHILDLVIFVCSYAIAGSGRNTTCRRLQPDSEATI
jgi:hypothetical protein